MTNDLGEPTEQTSALSTRTTYEAVTHALMTTKMTDKAGKPAGTALDWCRPSKRSTARRHVRAAICSFARTALKPDALQKLKD